MKKVRTSAAVLFLAAALAWMNGPPQAGAQAYPSQDVHFIVGFAAGSGPTSSPVLSLKKCDLF